MFFWSKDVASVVLSKFSFQRQQSNKIENNKQESKLHGNKLNVKGKNT
jgi:hypothetical protein